MNVFLGYQLLEKFKVREYNYISRSTLQENLEQMNITINIDGVDKTVLSSPITGSVHFFEEHRLNDLFDNQKFEIVSETTIHSTLKVPYKLLETNTGSVISAFLQENVYLGKDYVISNINQEQNMISLHQAYEGNPIDNNGESGYHLVINLNKDYEVTDYFQSYMDIEQQGREQEILSPIKVIERLFNERLIPANTEISHIKLGYYSQLPPSGNYQIFTPMWQIRINETFHYVNAIDGAIQPAK